MDNKRNNRYSNYTDNSHIDGHWNNSGYSYRRIQNNIRPVKGIIRLISDKIRYGKLKRLIF